MSQNQQETDYYYRAALGYFLSQSLYTVVQLNVAEQLKAGALSASEIAKKLTEEVNTDYLERVLNLLCSEKIFQKINDQFSLTKRGEHLLADHPQSMKTMIQFFVSPWHWQPWGNLLQSIKQGKPAFECTYQEDVFSYLAKNQEASVLFNKAMSALQSTLDDLTTHYDFSKLAHIVDVGGGRGGFIRHILKQHPNITGTLFDMPHIIDQSLTEINAEPDVAKRLELYRGSFFEQYPGNADAYLFKFILHDWDDERCLKILQGVAQAMHDDAKVIVFERIIDEVNEPGVCAWIDMEMLTMTPRGRERTVEQYQQLLASINLVLVKHIKTQSQLHILEFVKQA